MLNFNFDNPSLYLENHLLEKYKKGKKFGLRIWRLGWLRIDVTLKQVLEIAKLR